MTGEMDKPQAAESSDGAEGPRMGPASPAKLDPTHTHPSPNPVAETASAESEPNPPGVFGAWTFDVNTVAGNLGGLFTAADPTATDDVEGRSVDPSDPSDDMGKAAANMANAATVELEHASKAAQETIGKAAEELGKGWGTFNTFLDDMLSAKPDPSNPDLSDDADVLNTFHTLFPDLDQDDEVVDHFKCSLLQKYRCYLNNATPEKTYALRGRLFVSTLHIAMQVLDDGGAFGGQPFGISIPFSDIGKIQKGAKSMLRVVTKSQSSLIFSDFESDSHFTGALSLLEHMAASASVPPPTEAEGDPEKEKDPPPPTG